MDDVVVEWFQELDDGCAHLVRALPSGAPEVTAVLGGSCEVVSTARRGDALLVLRGTGQVDRVVGDTVEPLEGDIGWPRQVGWTTDGVPLLLAADVAGEATDEGAPFRVQTLAWGDGWVLRDETVETRRTVRAVEGGATWAARAPGGSVDAWTLEQAPGFALVPGDELPLRKKLRFEGTPFWGTVPVPGGSVAVRYTILGVLMPAGPVLRSRGKRWSLLDDARFLEAPASVEVRGTWLLVTYEGWNPVLVDLETGARPWSDEEAAGLSGVRFLP